MGKSTVLNFLIGDERMQTFEASRSERGVTRDVHIVCDRKFLGDDESTLVTVVDVPGIGDPTLDVEDILSAVENKLKTSKIDMVLLVLKATDDRVTLADVMVMQMFFLFEHINPQNVVVVFTRCDQDSVPDEFVEEKLSILSSYAKSAGLTLNPENIVRFDRTKESLRDLKRFLRVGNMSIKDNLIERALELTRGLPELISGGDLNEIAHLRQQLEELQKIRVEKEANASADLLRLEEQFAIQNQALLQERKHAEQRLRDQTAKFHSNEPPEPPPQYLCEDNVRSSSYGGAYPSGYPTASPSGYGGASLPRFCTYPPSYGGFPLSGNSTLVGNYTLQQGNGHQRREDAILDKITAEHYQDQAKQRAMANKIAELEQELKCTSYRLEEVRRYSD